MRHTPDLHANSNRAVTAPIDTHSSDLGRFSGPQHDMPSANPAVVPITPARLSQSAATGELYLIKRIIRARGKRMDHFDSHLFADPAWDILLNLARAEIEHRRTSISDLCHAAYVPATTALRWINTMTVEGKLERQPDAFDRRRVYMTLSEQSSVAMKTYLQAVQS
jgi:DNA-binding MarR family transcriptional regulator